MLKSLYPSWSHRIYFKMQNTVFIIINIGLKLRVENIKLFAFFQLIFEPKIHIWTSQFYGGYMLWSSDWAVSGKLSMLNKNRKWQFKKSYVVLHKGVCCLWFCGSLWKDIYCDRRKLEGSMLCQCSAIHSSGKHPNWLSRLIGRTAENWLGTMFLSKPEKNLIASLLIRRKSINSTHHL